MPGAVVVFLPGCQDPALQGVLRDQTARTATVARVSPAVCSVMDMESPGGGSGVIIDPAGFVLTNFHVVGEPDDVRKPGPRQPKMPGQKPAEEKPPESVLPAAPEPPAAEFERFDREHQDAGDEARKQFVVEWQAAWREEHLPKGKHHYKNKKVGLPDGQLYEAVVLGVDPGSDLAMLRLLPKGTGQTWPWCRLGDSDQLLVGETVFAMGNPFLLATDFTPTVTFGIVSGTH